MRQGESREAIADARLGLVGDLVPARADIDAEPFEAEQHRGGVLHVDIEVGLRLRQRAGEIAEALVVELEHRVEFPALEMEQRAVPPQMMQQVVAALPVPLQFVEPRDAFGVAALHLHDVRDRMRAPDVARIDRDGGSAGWLRGRVVAALLKREAMTGQDRAVARKIAAPFRLHPLDRGAHLARPSEPEIVEMREPKRQHVERMIAQDLLPNASARSRSPAIQASSAATCDCSRAVACAVNWRAARAASTATGMFACLYESSAK